MLLTAEVRDDHYADLPRQQAPQYAYPAAQYLKADASSGRNYIDLNAAAKTYSGAWLFGKQHVQVGVNGMRAEWVQWCPIPAGIADGVMLKGNVIYQNQDGSYRMSNDLYEGIIRTEGYTRVFEGQTQHTFRGANLPNGQVQVVANLNIPLNQQLAYNPMIVMPHTQQAQQPQQSPQAPQPRSGYTAMEPGYAQAPDAGF